MSPYQTKTFEQDVYNTILECLSEDETITFDRYFDFRVPNGVKELKWDKDTVIEVKFRLIYNSYERIKHKFDLYNPQKLIVVVIEDDVFPLLNSNATITGRNIEILSYAELRLREETLNIGNEKKKISSDIETVYQKEKDNQIHIKLKDALRNNKMSVFVGAGVSASAGVATWNELLEQLCVTKNINKIDNEIDSVVKGRYIIDEYKKREKIIPADFYEDMRRILYAHTKQSPLIESISLLIKECDVESVISYNYDDLVEQEIRKTKNCCAVYDKSRPVNKNCLHIYHVHGFIPQKGEYSNIILGEKEYHKIYSESYNWGNVEQLHALSRSTCLFLGLSMADPNLRRLIDISIEDSEIEPVHFAFLRRVEYNVPFMEKIMRGFGINCVWYDKYDDLPHLINDLVTGLLHYNA